MTTFENWWRKLRSKKYRESLVTDHAKRAVSFQIRTLLKTKGLSQKELATRAGLTQGVISRAADPNYGNLTLNTLVRVAAGFDVAFIGKFVPFSELIRRMDSLPSEAFDVATFGDENERYAGATGFKGVGSSATGCTIETESTGVVAAHGGIAGADLSANRSGVALLHEIKARGSMVSFGGLRHDGIYNKMEIASHG